MTSQPLIRVPSGMTMITLDDGSIEVVKSAEPLTKTVAFRMPASLYADVHGFVTTFPGHGWGEGMRWLLDDPRVRAVMAERIAFVTRPKDSLQGRPDQRVAG